MSTEVQTMAGLGSDDGPVALRTPLYLIVAVLGLLIVVCTFLPWAGVVSPPSGPGGDITSVTGLDAGGWGAAALVAGIAIMALGVLGYFWNPFSDPEALFIAGFGAAVAIAALLKVLDPASLLTGTEDFDSVNAGSRIGLWLIFILGLDALLAGLWITYSRPKAQDRLS